MNFRIGPRRIIALLLALLPSQPLAGQEAAQLPEGPTNSGALTLFPRPEAARFIIAGQANIVFQSHGPMHSSYEGANSFLSRGEYKTSLVGTLVLGYQLLRNEQDGTNVILDIESAGGRGLSQALGLAGFTNLDVVRNPNLGSKPYIARIQLHQTIGSRRTSSRSTELPTPSPPTPPSAAWSSTSAK